MFQAKLQRFTDLMLSFLLYMSSTAFCLNFGPKNQLLRDYMVIFLIFLIFMYSVAYVTLILLILKIYLLKIDVFKRQMLILLVIVNIILRVEAQSSIFLSLHFMTLDFLPYNLFVFELNLQYHFSNKA